MSPKSLLDKYQSFVKAIAPTATVISLFIPIILMFVAWSNRGNKLFFFIIIGMVVSLLVLIISWCYRFRRVNKYVCLTWRQDRFAKREKLHATKMRGAFSKMIDYQSKIENMQKARETIWNELLDNPGEISRAQIRQRIANRFLESADETHEAALKRRIRVLVWLINYDQLDINRNPYKEIRDKYIPQQIILRKDSDIYFR